MTFRQAAVLGAIAVGLFLVGLVYGNTKVETAGEQCGSPFDPQVEQIQLRDSVSRLVDAYTNQAAHDDGTSRAAQACTEALDGRKNTATVFIGVGVAAAAGSFVALLTARPVAATQPAGRAN